MNKKNTILNVDASKVIKRLKELKKEKKISNLYDLDPDNARKEFKKIRKYFQKKLSLSNIITKDFYIENIKVRHYICKNKLSKKKRALMLYIHAGGWVLGDIETHNNICMQLADNARYDVISLEYSLAPESPFPKPINDCIKVLSWIFKNSSKINVCKRKIMLCGDSAGANLVSVLCFYARDIIKKNILLQILIYPSVVFGGKFSSKKNYDGLILSNKLLAWFEDHYLPKYMRKKYINDYRVSPSKANSFRNLAPTFIAIAECDPLCDEGIYFSKLLKKSGNKLEMVVFKGQIHGFLTMDKEIKDAVKLIKKIKNKAHSALDNI